MARTADRFYVYEHMRNDAGGMTRWHFDNCKENK